MLINMEYEVHKARMTISAHVIMQTIIINIMIRTMNEDCSFQCLSWCVFKWVLIDLEMCSMIGYASMFLRVTRLLSMNSLSLVLFSAPEWVAMGLPWSKRINIGKPWMLNMSTVSSWISVSTLTNFKSGSSSLTTLNIGATS